MRKILTSFAIIASLVLATAAVAQSTGGVGQGSGSSATSQGRGATGAGSGAAPVGHRQPRVADVPGEKNDGATTDSRDAALDRALRSICRGC